MVVKLLSRLFGGSSSSNAEVPAKPSNTSVVNHGPDPVGLVDYLIRGLAGVPDEVRIESATEDGSLVIKVYCNKSDMGRVIGKKGKTIGAIRHLATDSAARNEMKIRRIEVVEPDKS